MHRLVNIVQETGSKVGPLSCQNDKLTREEEAGQRNLNSSGCHKKNHNALENK
jgi:hypothetical protein